MADKNPNTECASCSKPLYRFPVRLRRAKNQFCSMTCRDQYKTTHWQERLWADVDKTSGYGPEGTCWLWTRPGTGFGYGRVRANRKTWLIHRLIWTITFGPIPDGLSVLHKCDVPLCANPDHYFLGSQRDNMDDMVKKGRNRKARGDQAGRRTRPDKYAIGEACNWAKLTEAQVLAIRAEHAAGGIGYVLLGRKYNVHQGTINHIILRRTWKHI